MNNGIIETIHNNVHHLFVHVTENIHDLCLFYTKYHNTIYGGTMKVIQEMMSDTVNIFEVVVANNCSNPLDFLNLFCSKNKIYHLGFTCLL